MIEIFLKVIIKIQDKIHSKIEKGLFVHQNFLLGDGLKSHNIKQYVYRFFSCIKLYHQKIVNIHYSKGTIVYVSFGVNIGSEINGIRPALIYKKTKFSEGSDIVVIPITSFDEKKSMDRFDIILESDFNNGLHHKSIIKTRQIKAISKKRIMKMVGKVSNTVLDHMDYNVSNLFGIKKPLESCDNRGQTHPFNLDGTSKYLIL